MRRQLSNTEGTQRYESFYRHYGLAPTRNNRGQAHESRYYTDGWGTYERHLDVDKHQVGKQNTQKIERKNLNWRTWIKRLMRKTICFSKLESLHDTVIGLLTNKVEFGVDIHQKMQV
jgi:IS1 family transposase